MRRITPVVALALCLFGCEKKVPPLTHEERVPEKPEALSPPDAEAPAAAAPTASASALPAKPTVSDTITTSKGPVAITPIHHGTVALSFDGKTIVLDPWSQAPAGWLPKADLVLITHDHPDHFDRDGITAVRKEGTQFVAPGVVAKDLPEAKVLKNGQKLELLGVSIRAVPMYNLTRGPTPGKLFHDKGRGNGYLLGFGDTTLYFSGDTECTPEMKALKNVDVAFVCMNLPYTMPVEEAAECVKAFKPKVIIPFHYRGSDTNAFKRALAGTPAVEVRLRDFYAGTTQK